MSIMYSVNYISSGFPFQSFIQSHYRTRKLYPNLKPFSNRSYNILTFLLFCCVLKIQWAYTSTVFFSLLYNHKTLFEKREKNNKLKHLNKVHFTTEILNEKKKTKKHIRWMNRLWLLKTKMIATINLSFKLVCKYI